MWVSMMSSSITNVRPLADGICTNLGSGPTGTLTLAYSWSWFLSNSLTAMLRELLEMKGNGWLTSSARGVSRGWILSL